MKRLDTGWSLALLAAVALTTSGCLRPATPWSPDGRPVENRYQRLEQIVAKDCVDCHSEPDADAHLDLEGGLTSVVDHDAHQSELKLIHPGDPAKSYLFRKVAGTHAEVGRGARMPKYSQRYGDDVLNNLEAWIQAGAQGE